MRQLLRMILFFVAALVLGEVIIWTIIRVMGH